MTIPEKPECWIKNKLGLLELSQPITGATQRVARLQDTMGYSRDSFYRPKEP